MNKLMKKFKKYDLVKFNYQMPKNSPFTILFASSPKDPERFIERGVYLMLDVAKEIKEEVFFDFSWAAEGPYLGSYLKIKDLIIKNLYKWEKLDKFKARQKMTAYLARKGFGWDIIRKVVEANLID